jgi:hypothetical protein
MWLTERGGRVAPAEINARFVAYRDALRLPEILTPHSLRHSWVICTASAVCGTWVQPGDTPVPYEYQVLRGTAVTCGTMKSSRAERAVSSRCITNPGSSTNPLLGSVERWPAPRTVSSSVDVLLAALEALESHRRVDHLHRGGRIRRGVHLARLHRGNPRTNRRRSTSPGPAQRRPSADARRQAHDGHGPVCARPSHRLRSDQDATRRARQTPTAATTAAAAIAAPPPAPRCRDRRTGRSDLTARIAELEDELCAARESLRRRSSNPRTAHNDDRDPHTAVAATHPVPHVPHVPDTQKWQTTSTFAKSSTGNLRH